MFSLTAKNLWFYKRRIIGIFLAVFIGVSFLAGTLSLGDTLRKAFGDLFTDLNRGVDVVVRADSQLSSEFATAQPLIDESLVSSVAQVEGVTKAVGYVEGYGQILGKDGKPLGGAGPPVLAGSWVTVPELNPYKIVSGRAPRGGNEVVIDKKMSRDGKLQIGDTTTVLTPEPVKVKVVGITLFGTLETSGGTTYTAFSLESAQKYVTKAPGKVNQVIVSGETPISSGELRDRIKPILPKNVEAITGAALTKETIDQINSDFLDFFTTFLTVFACIALFVSCFSIFNTFSIVFAQRTQQSAMMRAIGASRGQMLRSYVIEAFAIGLLASVAALAGGYGVAIGVKALLNGFGFGLPAGSPVFTANTVIISLLVGTVLTTFVGVFPAIRASRVPPLAAMRDVAAENTSVSRVRVGLGVVIGIIGLLLVITQALGEGGDTALLLAGLGAALTLVGMVILGPVAAGTAARVLGAPAARTRGVAGQLAQQNARRNPRRTSGAAAILFVAIAVVALILTVTTSLVATIDKSVERSFAGDFAIVSGSFSSGLTPELAPAVQKLPEVEQAVGLGFGSAQIGRKRTPLTVVEPEGFARLVDLKVVEGSIGSLNKGAIAVSENAAESEKYSLGSKVTFTFRDGVKQSLPIGAIYTARDIAGEYVMPTSIYDPHESQRLDLQVFITLKEGVDKSDGQAAIEKAVKPFGSPDVLDRQGFIDTIAAGVNQFLGLVLGMLGLSIVIAIFGIANTLSLAIYERTRELGLARAVGQTRRQVRVMVRWEAVIVSLFGTLGGIGLGAFFGWALTRAAASELDGFQFAISPVYFAGLVIFGLLVGVVAAIRPARRAARLDVLKAIAGH